MLIPLGMLTGMFERNKRMYNLRTMHQSKQSLWAFSLLTWWWLHVPHPPAALLA
jgi:hypothetical protein